MDNEDITDEATGIPVELLQFLKKTLTAEEWWLFAPWQDMDSIPKNKMVLIRCVDGDIYPSVVNENGKISSAVSYKIGIDSVRVQDYFVGWLPLPTVQS